MICYANIYVFTSSHIHIYIRFSVGRWEPGADVNARLDAYGGTALFLAIEQGNWPMVKWFLGKIDR
jgi:ankyrin repeat protein